ncbi:PREDICTED: uncharacterized protein LOC104824525 [Tarenaya hassleriana]|uniref:uncharacterized protein LOC104824525 n=1 Tax=Tarenaya hassleriana TaxID=28532 RepID=UPI00053C2B8C|nr:PREDICTED: uncharacterized protein LOC104824525 [Tarenaya hassleriana]
MEGLIPFVYRAVMQFRYGDETPFSSYYVRLPGDSGRFGRPGFQVSDLGSSSSSSCNTTSSGFSSFVASDAMTNIVVSTGSPLTGLSSSGRHVIHTRS